MHIGTRSFDTENDCYIMGILNVTPDSFSDGGKWNDLSRALAHTEDMIREGASIIDIGGESTRPGHIQISIQEEIQRVTPYIEAIKARFDIPVSIDTYKSQVAQAALLAGADMVNDIWGLKYDPQMAQVIARHRVPCCLMHNRREAVYEDFFPDYLKDIEEILALADAAGIPREQIILDPGVGFGKTYEQNLTVINRLEALHDFGCPVLLATSRKSVIGLTLDLPSDQRVEGTLVTTMMGVEKKAAFVRVHDVRENYRAIRMTQAILQERKPSHEASL
ncbi:MAG: dihydropteroate synthase [Eubacteriales bacterium]|nr:dihydropteroate synthase [Eubacteriales bacterium]